MKNNKRNFEIINLWGEGKTMREIGKLYNVTRQRVQQIVSKSKTYKDQKKREEARPPTHGIIKCKYCGKKVAKKLTQFCCSLNCSLLMRGKTKYYSRQHGEDVAAYNRNRRKAYYKNNLVYRQKIKDNMRLYEQNNRVKVCSRRKVYYALKKGQITKPDHCSKCAKHVNEFPRLEAHHQDYSKPLVVTWLCTKCHKTLHSEQKMR